MRVVLGITMRNEVQYGPHVRWQIEDALSMDYDDIVVLDDGSNDGTWQILKEYEKKYPKRLHVYRNQRNSIKNEQGTNRWMSLVKYMERYRPTWINIRAADQVYSQYYRKNMRNVLGYYEKTDVKVIKFPCIHLWRSESWYRIDGVWGNDSRRSSKFQVWRYNQNYRYLPKQRVAVLHKGQHFPMDLGFEEDDPRQVGVNTYFKDRAIDRGGHLDYFPIVVLHYGHTTHEKKAAKFDLSMEVAGKNAMGMPGADKMPHPRTWLRYNGYKGFYEFNLKLAPVNLMWFPKGFKRSPKPTIDSFYKTIAKYNVEQAKNYQEMYDKFKLGEVNNDNY